MALSSRIAAACTPEFATDREASEIKALLAKGSVLLYARARVWRAGKRYYTYTYRVRYLGAGRKTYPSPAKFARHLLWPRKKPPGTRTDPFEGRNRSEPTRIFTA